MNADEIPTIDSTDVQDRLDQGWQIVDVRTDDEWADSRIDGSLHIPLDQLIERRDEVPDPAVMVCAHGHRSAQAAAYLNDQGRTAVNLAGGLHAWEDAGRPLAH